MIHSFDGYNDVIRLQAGEHLMAALEQFATETTLQGAWLSGIGAASEVTIGFYNLGSKEYKWRTFGRTMEVLSLAGNMSFDEAGKLVVHVHGVFGDDEYQTVGGHVKDLVAGATIELFVHRAYQPLRRAYDDATGLELLDPHQ